jgi:dTDP-4-dehydrorhamnose reductase
VNRVLVFGATSMVGSDFVGRSRLPCSAAGRSDPRSFGLAVNAFYSMNTDDETSIERVIRSESWSAVVNFSAKTDVNAVESERNLPDFAGPGTAWRANVVAPESMARIARISSIPFVQISTDFVFDGSAGPYSESTAPSHDAGSLSWYGWTKAEAERQVLAAYPEATIVRVSYPYRARFDRKLDFARRVIASYRSGTIPPLYSDQQFTPTWIPDLTAAIVRLLEAGESGTYHVASPELTTPFDFGRELLARFANHPVDVPCGSMEVALTDPRSIRRPRIGGLRTELIRRAGVKLTSWKEGADLVAVEARHA